MKKILLLSMPFGALERQALGISLLKACLTKLHIPCDVRYLTFAFAESIGYDDYQWIATQLPYTAFVGDWTFTQALYDTRAEAEQPYIQEILRETWHLSESDIGRILRIRAVIPFFLDRCLASIAWSDYAVVGFTSTFEQNIASLALAKKIKAINPEIRIIFGGANWEGVMGQELHRQFTFIDYVCSGEADETFPRLVQHILADGSVDEQTDMIPGLVLRRQNESVYTGSPPLIRQLDDLPIPDFSDYFEQLNQSTIAASALPTLILETSRGCWWGAKSHCTFCGLNGESMTYRSKSASRVLDELTYLVDQWNIDFVAVVDNILDMHYFHDLLPTLAKANRSLRLFYEVKANLSREHIRILYAAGVHRIQPGIESMSDHILKLMRKGTTALRNIQLLKWCKEYGIGVDWNILYGFPGETEADYAAMLPLLHQIRFLGPPTACGPVRMDRFSPYFNAPQSFGLMNIRPLAPYKHLYPFADASLHQIAYYFDYDYVGEVDPTGLAANVIAHIAEWQRNPEHGTLSALVGQTGELKLLDTRSDAVLPEVTLVGIDRAIYEYCDEMRTLPSIVQYCRQHFPAHVWEEQSIYNFLESLVANKLMVSNDKYYLSLAIFVTPIQLVRKDATINLMPRVYNVNMETVSTAGGIVS